MILWRCTQSERGEGGFRPCWSIWTLLLLASAAGGCGGEKHNPGPDGTPPATITNLTVLAADDTSITLGWTAPGDDGDRGTAARYDLRYSLDQLPPAWNIATPMDSLPAPRLAGALILLGRPRPSRNNKATMYVRIRNCLLTDGNTLVQNCPEEIEWTRWRTGLRIGWVSGRGRRRVRNQARMELSGPG